MASNKTPHPISNEMPPADQAQPLQHLHRFLPPHFAVLCNEESSEFNQLFDELLAVYQPANAAAFHVVRDIAVARWQILRLDSCLTNQWNIAILEQSTQPITLDPALTELQIMSRATESLITGSGFLRHCVRITDSLTRRIDRLERSLRFVNTHYGTRVIEPIPAPAPPPPAQDEAPETAPQADAAPVAEPNPNQPIYVTENTPSVINYYRQLFPGRRIVVLPADDVARGIDVKDDMPDIPRKVA